MNILLIGFMGCGKTSLGKKLAKKMGYGFVDLDKVIEQNEKLTIPEIFKIKGETYFRELESKWLSQYKENNFVISLGGGTPCFNENMEVINKIGISVYLKMNSGLLTDRLFHAKQKRPLIEEFKNNKEQLNVEIEKMLKIRAKYYEKANIDFEASNMSSVKMDVLSELILNHKSQ